MHYYEEHVALHQNVRFLTPVSVQTGRTELVKEQWCILSSKILISYFGASWQYYMYGYEEHYQYCGTRDHWTSYQTKGNNSHTNALLHKENF